MINFSDFSNRAWADHAKNPTDVALRLLTSSELVESAEQIPLLANLISHVYGEHLGRWQEGIDLLEKLRLNKFFAVGSESAAAISRLQASLKVAGFNLNDLSTFSVSDQIRILAVAASALCEQKDVARAQSLFSEAAQMAGDLAKDDPANRALAVTGNNLAAALEEKSGLSADETRLMIEAAKVARKFWEIAGTWLHVERAEYRLAKSYLRADESSRAAEHARKCLEIVMSNGSVPLEEFFAYEVLILSQKACGQNYLESLRKMKSAFEQLSDQDKNWCRATLDKLSG